MPIPDFTPEKLLPEGIHDCTIADIAAKLCWNDHRQALMDTFLVCLRDEIRPRFDEPIIFDGSFVTQIDHPGDIDMAVDLASSSDAQQRRGIAFMNLHRWNLKDKYKIDVLVNLPADGLDFQQFFQRAMATHPVHGKMYTGKSKGILRLS